MNKTISINLGGSVFNIEEGAFHILRIYLEKIKANFTNDPSGDEIMQDIEVRIAELFSDRMNERKNVVVETDVQEVIAIMGRPEDYSMDASDEPKRDQNQNNTRNSQRRLYRDEDDKVLGGVCAGLSHYFGVDPIVIRLIVVLIFFISGGTAILGYILFWALVPKAETTAEKLQMRGESVNINNITRMVNDEARAASERLSRSGRRASSQVRENLSEASSTFGRVLSLIFGLIIMIIGFGLLIGLMSILIASDFNFFGFGSGGFDMISQLVFGDDGTLWMLVLGTILAMGAPAIALMYVGIKLITGSTRKIRGLALSLISLFTVGVILCVYGGIKTGKEFTSHEEVVETNIIPASVGDTLYIEILPDVVFNRTNDKHYEFGDLTKVTDSLIYYGEPVNLRFEPTNDKDYKLRVVRCAQGRNREIASTLARNIDYHYEVSGDSLFFNSYLSTPSKDLYRAQLVDLIIYVPVGKYVAFGDQSRRITWEGESGQVLRMDDEGLDNERYRRDHDLEDERETRERLERETNGRIILEDDSITIKTKGGEIKLERD